MGKTKQKRKMKFDNFITMYISFHPINSKKNYFGIELEIIIFPKIWLPITRLVNALSGSIPNWKIFNFYNYYFLVSQ